MKNWLPHIILWGLWSFLSIIVVQVLAKADAVSMYVFGIIWLILPTIMEVYLYRNNK